MLVTSTLGPPTLRSVPSERGCYEAFYEQVADAIRLGKPAPVDASDAALVVRIIECARESAATASQLVRV